MKQGLTELVIIIDKSGSMHSLKNDVIGGFNSLIDSQKKDEGEVLVTTVLFSTKERIIHSREDIKNIKELTVNDYIPDGCTALLDTVGNAISRIKALHSQMKEECVPEHTIFSIMTDGLENASVEYTYDAVKKLIDEQKEKGWDFLFQAANIDAFKEGNRLGISKEDIASFEGSSVGVKCCFKCVNTAIKHKKAKAK